MLGRGCREAFGWFPTLIWLWFHTSFPSRPGEAKLHRWPSGWHFRTWPSAHSQTSYPTLLCFSALLILQRSDWARTERHWRWRWAGDSSTGLAHGRAPHLTCDQTLIQEDPCLCCSAPEAGEAGCRENYAASTGKILLI